MNQMKTLSLRFRFHLTRPFHYSGSPRTSSTFARPRLAGEEPDFYGEGGFHRVALGDTFDAGRYHILRKLGYGQYSTVWLARDSKHQRYVALKILRADCYGGPERGILSKITDISARSKHEGRHHILPFLHQFKHIGPNGVHVCFVLEVLGHHLYFQCSKYKDGRLPVRAIKRIARQLLLGLDFLHTECGVIHTDMHPKNILLELEDPHTAISRHLSEVPPRTDTQSGEVLPLREVMKIPPISEIKEPYIRIIDFGVATYRHKHHSQKIQPPALRAPEVTIGAPWDTGVDIWSLGCLVVEFMQGIVLFSGQESKHGDWTADDDRLAKTIEVLGPFPLELLKKGNNSGELFHENGDLRRIANLVPTTLESIINGSASPFLKPNDMPDAQVPVFIDFLKGMLTINPDHRRAAADLLQHEWLNL
ncbi:CMGC/SRPK protein kinase, variant 2 [Blastomyces dermatitidis ATCC 26199]|nr:CMGC/SRPK protein kinase [Blastomyces dermatitidis ATCC 26199]EQL38807.1 CMGC/SRPK protein kinase, variant 1 [Blastomyces dermatitidis ATCC 26199]EQL38808.1 CMGC/SRPK protein kinase, variant 2 [Blastomyces dermatitidis ATCC 26199]